ncbi:DUF397 domain-containing protein [Streptomyces sp. NPDC057280]|uniref:DUF397 domain-containing protein n=1 Tax=Streptomyces sp. NPDC057280 TaxID=3346081 RepID=UPI00363A5A1D
MGSNLDVTRAQWRKSSYSGSSGGDCVEVAQLAPHIAVRDSKNPHAGAFFVTQEAFTRFVTAAGDGVLR